MIAIQNQDFNSPVRTIDAVAEHFISSAIVRSGEYISWDLKDIQSVISGDIKIKVRKHNLIPYPYIDIDISAKNGLTFENVDNLGWVEVNGTATETINYIIADGLRLEAGTYFLGSDTFYRGCSITMQLYDVNKDTYSDITSSGNFTIDNTNEAYIYLTITKGTVINGMLIAPFLVISPLDAESMSYTHFPYIDDITTVPIMINNQTYYPDEEGLIEGISYSNTFECYAPNGGVLLDVYCTRQAYRDRFTKSSGIKSITVERTGEQGKFFGFGISHKAKIELVGTDARTKGILNSDCFKLKFTLNDITTRVFPTFYIDEFNRDENTNNLTITVYDALQRASEASLSDLEITPPYTIRQLAFKCAGALGLALSIEVNEDNSPFDLAYPAGANFGGEESIRAILDDIAEATQTIYYVNENDWLVFKRLNRDGEPVLTIGKDAYFTLQTKDPKTLNSIVSATELGDNVETEHSGEGVPQYVRDNAFWELREDVATLIEEALPRVIGTTIHQFECSWRGNYLLELGDKINLITKDDEIITSYLLNDTITYGGGFSQKSSWSYEDKGETATNPTTLGEILNITYARVNKMDKKIDIVASQAELNSSNIAQINMTTNDIKASVEEVKKNTNSAVDGVNKNIETLTKRVEAAITAEDVKIAVQSELENGVDKVITTTGFTFNEEGLSVSKSGSEMTTQITEDGMIVFRNETAVLVANNEGVDATNLRATTYLIIGENSRFEDYNNEDRTGCFWIGG